MSNAIIPIPRCELSIRSATMSDYAFIDRLQQMHSKAVGFMPKAQLESKIAAGHVLVAWASRPCSEDMAETAMLREEPVGYCMSQDRYFKRDDVGIVYQMNVSPGAQRKLVAATMLQAVFDHAAYGCKLFCCWCAQDLDANYFWESMGFVPLAFRTGAVGRLARGQQPRAHIFWQKRIREGDVSTPFWYPCKTDGGSMREDRIVLPIPPGTHWSDAMPMLLPDVACPSRACLPNKKCKTMGVGSRSAGGDPMLLPPTRRGARFGAPSAIPAPEPVAEKKKAAKKAKAKCNPEHLAKARELRDRYLEQFNGGLALPGGKYEVSRQIEAEAKASPLLLGNVAPNAQAA